jgi:uncharacterized protein YjbI with pentapeptide repeats
VPLVVKDRDGNFLLEVEGANFLDCKSLRRADFSGEQLEGIYIADSDLREADFTGADLYRANAFRANCEGAIFRNAELNGANLEQTNLRGADLQGAYISLDNLFGSPQLQGADLTGALLDETVFIGCEYDDSTVFPSGFDPAAHGMIWIDPERIYIRPGSFASATLEQGYYLPDKKNPGSFIPWKRN